MVAEKDPLDTVTGVVKVMVSGPKPIEGILATPVKPLPVTETWSPFAPEVGLTDKLAKPN